MVYLYLVIIYMGFFSFYYWRELDCKILQGYLKPRLNKLPKKKKKKENKEKKERNDQKIFHSSAKLIASD